MSRNLTVAQLGCGHSRDNHPDDPEPVTLMRPARRVRWCQTCQRVQSVVQLSHVRSALSEPRSRGITQLVEKPDLSGGATRRLTA